MRQPYAKSQLSGDGRLLIDLPAAEAPLVLGLGHVAVRECRQPAVGSSPRPPEVGVGRIRFEADQHFQGVPAAGWLDQCRERRHQR